MDFPGPRRRTLRSFQETTPEGNASSNAGSSEPPANTVDSRPQRIARLNSHSRPEAPHPASSLPQPTYQSFFAPQTTGYLTIAPEAPFSTASPSRGRASSRRGNATYGRRGTGRGPTLSSPPRGDTLRGQGQGGLNIDDPFEHDLALALQYDLSAEDGAESSGEDDFSSARRAVFPTGHGGEEPYNTDLHGVRHRMHQPARGYQRFGQSQSPSGGTATNSLSYSHPSMPGDSKRSRDRFENADERDLASALHSKGAVAVMLYNSASPNPEANDVWPECRSLAKLPARYSFLDRDKQTPHEHISKRQPSKRNKKKAPSAGRQEETDGQHLDTPVGRPEWKLPVELVELIANHLNRDDIKALRLVSHEINRNVSQVIFKTVVVPFNTEIYGMLGQELKPDLKGKKRAKVDRPEYSWKNANGDEVYNGHGLDVFRGFGQHIRKYGMSFQVNEETLATPPLKSLTEKKTSFWGNYDWPFEEYRRFDAVAGLETAADETPRMKVAFSELTQVRELALSVDSGLGWLNGPDRSMRARILRKPPHVFGTTKTIPDRRSQAQQELWRHIELCHENAGSDVRLANLYRMDGQLPLSELEEASLLGDIQPDMPYLDPRLVHEAIPHDTADIQVPASFDDPYTLDRFILTPPTSGMGILYSSTVAPSEAGQLMSPIIPANLTKAQKEWLLETEWAQRAFMSSYMLSIIDNPTIFWPIYTLNVSGLSDRYLAMLSRSDFWDALPNLRNVTIMVIPGWRTVQKDEAGFVDTPKVDPTYGTNLLCDLLRNHIACRANIRDLTVGWVTGGEHAEGLHARNRLLFPAPVVDLGTRANNGASLTSSRLTETNVSRLRESLLQFPYVERLTLKNCWITPPALLHFVHIHDSHTLKSLVLDSVSLTAMLRPVAHAHQAAQQVAALHMGVPAAGNPPMFLQALNHIPGVQAAAQFVPNHQQLMQVYVQTLQLQLQQMLANAGGMQQQTQIHTLQVQLQQQVQLMHMQMHHWHPPPPLAQAQGQPQAQSQVHVQQTPGHAHQNQPAAPQINFVAVTNLAAQVQQLQNQLAAGQQPAAAPANHQTNADPQSALKAQPREGSWMDIIDQISPGTHLSDFDSEYSQANIDRITSLQTVDFRSCGYAKLPYASLDQAAIGQGHGIAAALRNPMFNRRQIALAPAMLSAKWAHLGEIVQEIDPSELAALEAGWNLRTGWDDAEEARAVEFDGLLPGGTGRFTGIIRQSDRVVDGASANSSDFGSRFGRMGLRN